MAGERVEIRSNHEYIGRPLAFYWQDRRLKVTAVLLQNHTPTGYTFRVQAEDAAIYELRYDLDADQWFVHQL